MAEQDLGWATEAEVASRTALEVQEVGAVMEVAEEVVVVEVRLRIRRVMSTRLMSDDRRGGRGGGGRGGPAGGQGAGDRGPPPESGERRLRKMIIKFAEEDVSCTRLDQLWVYIRLEGRRVEGRDQHQARKV